MKANDAIIGVIALLFGVAVAAYSQTFPVMAGMTVGPSLFPTIIGTAMALCGAGLIATGLARRFSDPGKAPWFQGDDWTKNWDSWARAIAVLAALGFYILASRTLGFHLTGFIILAGLLAQFGVRWLLVLPVSLATVLIIHYLFYSVLRVPLPWGILLPVAW